MHTVYYCNPNGLVGTAPTLQAAVALAKSTHYCCYVVAPAGGAIVWCSGPSMAALLGLACNAPV
jgi:hypothetical protein